MKRYRKETNHDTAWFIILLIVFVVVLCIIEFCISGICDGLTPQSIAHTLMHKRAQSSFLWDDFNMYGNLAFVFALFSLWYTFRSYKSQSQTERNTSNVPIDDQKGRFHDLARHEYRNLVCALSTAIKYFGKDNFRDGLPLYYPSESHILKLQAAPDDFVLDINPQMASDMSEMRLVLRNYNIEINVASKHLSRCNISQKTITQDYDNLIFKPLFLVKKACNVELKLDNKQMVQEADNEYKAPLWLEKLWGRIVFWKKAAPSDEEQCRVLLDHVIGIIVAEHLGKISSSLRDLMGEDRAEQRNPHARYFRYFSMMQEGTGMTIKGADFTGACERSFNMLFKEKLNNEQGTLLWSGEFDDKKKDTEVKNNIEKVLCTLDKLKERRPDCYNRLRGYRSSLESIRDGRAVDFKGVFALMLKMDVIVELRKIGMVNFDSDAR